MNTKWKLGTWFGTGVYLHWTFLIFLAYILIFAGGLIGAAYISALFACVVAHEYGHVLAAKQFGIGTRDITLYPIGGVAALKAMPKRPREEMIVALAGPAVNVAIAFVLSVFLLLTGRWGGFATNIALANVFLAAFNLLPAFPMDGGRVLRAWLARRYDHATATDKAATVGRVFAGIFAVIAIAKGMTMFLILAIFVYLAAGAERRQALLDRERQRFGIPFGHGGSRSAPVIEVEAIPIPHPSRPVYRS